MKKLIRLIYETFAIHVDEVENLVEELRNSAKWATDQIYYAIEHPLCPDANHEAYEAVSLLGVEPANEECFRLYGSVDKISKIVTDLTDNLGQWDLASDAMKQVKDKVESAYQVVYDLVGEFSAPLDAYYEHSAKWDKIAGVNAKYIEDPDGVAIVPDPDGERKNLQIALEYAGFCANLNTSLLSELEGLEKDLVHAIGFCSPFCLQDLEFRNEHITELLKG